MLPGCCPGAHPRGVLRCSDELAAVVHARLVLVGADGHRLHEEVFAAGGRIRGGRFARFRNRVLAQMKRLIHDEE